MDYSHKFWVPEFNLRNINLASLASEAAVDISNCALGNSQEDKSVQHLSSLLNDLTQGENPRALLPDNCVVLGYAISGRENFKEYWEGKNASEVLLQINLAAKDLRDFKSLPKERQETLTNFCVNLSKEVASNHGQYYSRLVA